MAEHQMGCESAGLACSGLTCNELTGSAAVLHRRPLLLPAGACRRLPPINTLLQEYYDKLPEPDDDENDMLDLAFGLTDT